MISLEVTGVVTLSDVEHDAAIVRRALELREREMQRVVRRSSGRGQRRREANAGDEPEASAVTAGRERRGRPERQHAENHDEQHGTAAFAQEIEHMTAQRIGLFGDYFVRHWQPSQCAQSSMTRRGTLLKSA